MYQLLFICQSWELKEDGLVHISAEAAERLKDRYIVEARDMIAVKGLGDVATFDLKALRLARVD